MNDKAVIEMLLQSFGEQAPVRVIAQYAEDEFMIPFKKAVALIYDAA